MRVLGVTLFFFGLSYLVRFIWDNFQKFIFNLEDENYQVFKYEISYLVVVTIDGLSFLALLTCHFFNFKSKDYHAQDDLTSVNSFVHAMTASGT